MAAGGSEELVARGSEELAAGCSEEMAAGSDVCDWRLEQTASQRFKLVSFHSHQVIKYALTYLLMPYFFTMYI